MPSLREGKGSLNRGVSMRGRKETSAREGPSWSLGNSYLEKKKNAWRSQKKKLGKTRVEINQRFPEKETFHRLRTGRSRKLGKDDQAQNWVKSGILHTWKDLNPISVLRESRDGRKES